MSSLPTTVPNAHAETLDLVHQNMTVFGGGALNEMLKLKLGLKGGP